MKTQLFFAALVALAAAALTAGCSSDKTAADPTPPEPPAPTLSLDRGAGPVVFTAAAKESFAYVVTTNQPSWDVDSDQTWCLVAKDSKGFTLTAVENTAPVPPLPATVTVKAGAAEPILLTVTQEVAQIDVYVVGIERTGSEYSSAVAKVWKNGKPWDQARYHATIPGALGDGEKSSYAESVYVWDGDVYVAGTEYRVPVIWKNGQPWDRTKYHDIQPGCLVKDDESSGDANSVYVSDGAVYVTGSHGDYAEVWKDGQPWETAQYNDTYEGALTDGTKSVAGLSILVSGKDVYVAGHENYFVAKIWKNGQPWDQAQYHASNPGALTNGKGMAGAYSLAVMNGHVLVAGYERNVSTGKDVAKVWEDGRPWSKPPYADGALTDGSKNATVHSIVATDEGTYVVGYDDHYAKVWKDGKPWDQAQYHTTSPGALTDGTLWSQANSVFVMGGSVYVVGYEDDAAKIWKDGKPWDQAQYHATNPGALTDGTHEAEASSVFVVQR